MMRRKVVRREMCICMIVCICVALQMYIGGDKIALMCGTE
jgi:hypothetical protein